MSQTRRLAAILAADVAGYSRLMGADEEGTLERLKALRRELLDPKIAEYHGRIVKTTGDGMLVEFPSVVHAVRCAVEVQQAMPGRNTPLSAPIAARADPPGSKMRPGGPAPGIAQWGGSGSGGHPVPDPPSQWGGWARPHWAPNRYNGLWSPPGAWGGPLHCMGRPLRALS